MTEILRSEQLKVGNKIATEFLRGYRQELKQRAKEAIIVYEKCGCNQHKQLAVQASDKAIEFDQEQQFLATGVICKETEKGIEYSARWELEMKHKQDKKKGRHG